MGTKIGEREDERDSSIVLMRDYGFYYTTDETIITRSGVRDAIFLSCCRSLWSCSLIHLSTPSSVHFIHIHRNILPTDPINYNRDVLPKNQLVGFAKFIIKSKKLCRWLHPISVGQNVYGAEVGNVEIQWEKCFSLLIIFLVFKISRFFPADIFFLAAKIDRFSRNYMLHLNNQLKFDDSVPWILWLDEFDLFFWLFTRFLNIFHFALIDSRPEEILESKKKFDLCRNWIKSTQHFLIFSIFTIYCEKNERTRICAFRTIWWNSPNFSWKKEKLEQSIKSQFFFCSNSAVRSSDILNNLF